MLIGQKVILRAIEKEDLVKFHQWRNLLEIKNLALMNPFPITLNSEEEWFDSIIRKRDDTFIIFSIIDREKNEVIGYAKLFNINWVHRISYFGIVIGDRQSQGKGIGEETTKLIIDYAFSNLNLRKIILDVVANNEKAINLYKKLGFDLEGTLKKHVFINSEYQDVLIMSLFK